MSRDAARQISYAHSAHSRAGRLVIRGLENATGRLSLLRRARGYQQQIAEGGDFWQVMCDRYGLRLKLIGGALDLIPRDGPLVVTANHPYGILDGLMMGRILSQRRADVRILAHEVFARAPDLRDVVLPISFEDSRRAAARNLATRRTAEATLATGGAIGIFPGGTVSTGARPFSEPLDPAWRLFTARLVVRSEATVVPIFFDGRTSRLFQLASHLHANLRLGLLIREFRRRVDTPVRIVIGAPLSSGDLAPYARDPRKMMDFLRATTYELSPSPVDPHALGRDFEAGTRS